MLAGLKEILFGNHRSSKSLAKSRLQFVLVQDRTGLSAEQLAGFKREMLEVIEKYFVVDEKGFDISYERANELTTLVINSPVVVRRQDSIDMSVGAKRNGGKNNKRKAETHCDQPAAANDPGL